MARAAGAVTAGDVLGWIFTISLTALIVIAAAWFALDLWERWEKRI